MGNKMRYRLLERNGRYRVQFQRFFFWWTVQCIVCLTRPPIYKPMEFDSMDDALECIKTISIASSKWRVVECSCEK